MKEIILSPEMSRELADIYATMELQYDAVAGKVGLSCSGCPDNCCDSYFLHYTYSEWAYIWEGIRALDDETLEKIVERSKRYVEESQKILQRKERPKLLCPLNDEGLCTLFSSAYDLSTPWYPSIHDQTRWTGTEISRLFSLSGNYPGKIPKGSRRPVHEPD